MEPHVIEFRNVLKRRRTKTIGPIQLSIPQGYIVALVGPNGSGKSTLLNMMVQTVFPDEGEVTWFGESYSKELPIEVRKQMAFVPEQLSVEEQHMTADQAATFRASWYDSWDGYFFDELMSRFDVPRGVKLRKMSKGERRKFEIAAALAPRPKLLLLDEPSSGLDPFAWKQMIDQLHKLMKSIDTTIILSTHVVDEIRRLADYVILIHHGKLLGMVEKDSLLDNWKECWIQGDASIVRELPGIISSRQENATTISFVTTECLEVENILRSAGMTFIQTRSLELDEVLRLWIDGHQPADMQK
ncbi:ABC transporter ATP-binding protein [Paenibacillus ihbetae]|uniref:Multidrug ABC transporter ATP-binding protein n=1 Tax=Paenibacillus ihbetae TaxID=1870820 RepID=A0A1B2DZF2_9BACL|nr:ABC transporter ATP-binding protein [Paenibacillus ihbetae]ANY73095.1 multidrug ABC transporter ATP-binding protein [Paenibacillus ihbetae]OOC59005.1 multidrug ABC transporter ATP-binding protein [Paenibacillus ihbetae]